MKKAKTGTKIYIVYGVLCLAVLMFGGVLHLLSPDRTYSPTEKRNLASAPELNFNTLTDGTFMSHTENYVADQFPFREFWMSLRMNALYTVGTRESKGVTYNSDGTLSEPYQGYDEELLQETAAALNGFVSAHGFEHAYALIVPTASELSKEALPPYAANESERAYFESLSEALSGDFRVFDVFPTLEEMKAEGKQVYYRTDHHWTTDAAYRVFRSLSEETGWIPGEYTEMTVTDRFSGSLASKSGFTVPRADGLKIYRNRNESLYSLLSYGNEGEIRGGFYDFDALGADNDPYTVFFGGNFPLITVRTTADTDRTLLVFKDSYANCFLPFLEESYKEIVIVDPRYYADRAADLFLQKNYTDFLCLYNVQTLSSDTNLKMILAEE